MRSIIVKESSAVGEVRRYVTELATKLKFPEIEIANMAIIACEAANNLIKHTKEGGEIILDVFHYDTQHSAINLLALDKGPGIANLTACLKDGYSTTGTQGSGLGAMQRLSTNFDIHTAKGLGTALWSQIVVCSNSLSQKKVDQDYCKANGFWDIGVVCIPISTEELCGDGWTVEVSPDKLNGLCLVVDGLGHGEGAHDATLEAVKAFHSARKLSLSLEELFKKIHGALSKTRGAAAAIAKLDLDNHRLEHVGIGNISSSLFGDDKRKSLVSLNGIMGHGIKKIQSFTYNLPKDFILCMYSDGLITHWEIEKYPGLLEKPAKLIAGILYPTFRTFLSKKSNCLFSRVIF